MSTSSRYSFRAALAGSLLALALAACQASTPAAAPTAASPAATATAIPAAATLAPAATQALVEATPAPAAVSAVAAKLNLNTATADDFLAAIPGFSSRMTREFLEYRPYVSIQQFRAEIGKYVDDAQVAQYEQYVYVPIAINDSDAATLQQIPGLDANEAAELMAGRPYAAADAFLAKLAGYVSADELAVARTYLSAP